MKMFKRKVDSHEQLDYYHGLIDRSDCALLLLENGDFLLRLREEYGNRKLTISCMHDKTLNNDNKIRHFDIQIVKGKESRHDKYSLDFTISANTVAHLIEQYVKYKRHVETYFHNPNKPILLIRPINRQAWELGEKDITLIKKIGQGEFGEVMTGTLLLKTGRKVDVAIKIAKPGTDPRKVTGFFTEARLMRTFDHPNVVKLYGVVYEPIMLVIELVPEGSLNNYLRQNKGKVTQEEKLDHMVMGSAWGLEYLHSKNCIHRDIACRNCLYSKSAVKISDFGLTRKGVIYTLKEARKLPLKWMSPETLDTGRYTPMSDVYSFGVMIWEIFSDGNEPFVCMSNNEVQKAIIGGLRLEFDIAPENLIDFVTTKMWDADPAKRPSMFDTCRSLEAMVNKEPHIPPANRKIMEYYRKHHEVFVEGESDEDINKELNLNKQKVQFLKQRQQSKPGYSQEAFNVMKKVKIRNKNTWDTEHASKKETPPAIGPRVRTNGTYNKETPPGIGPKVRTIGTLNKETPPGTGPKVRTIGTPKKETPPGIGPKVRTIGTPKKETPPEATPRFRTIEMSKKETQPGIGQRIRNIGKSARIHRVAQREKI